MWEAATVERTASPRDAPICRLLLTSPEARPASSRGNPAGGRQGDRGEGQPHAEGGQDPAPAGPVQ